MSRVTYFIQQAHTGTGVSYSHTQEKTRGRFWKNAEEWPRGTEISKEEIPGSMHSMCGYILTYSRLYRENLLSSLFSTDGDFNFCVRSSPLLSKRARKTMEPLIKSNTSRKRATKTVERFLKSHTTREEPHKMESLYKGGLGKEAAVETLIILQPQQILHTAEPLAK